jgi:hypothetical protein
MASDYPIGFPTKEFGWKGKPFFQVIATIQHNRYSRRNPPNLTPHQLRKAFPLKIYRKEIFSISNITKYAKTCSTRASMKIDDFDRPGNNIVSEVPQSYHINS